MGRPSTYTDEVSFELCERLSAGESLEKVCTDPEMPAPRTVYQWLARHEAFAQNYTRAKNDSAHAHGERVLDLIDKVVSGEVNPNAARVAIDGLKWVAARMMPKRFGDRVDATLHGDITVVVDEIKRAK